MDMAKASLGRLENARDNLKFLAETQEGNTTEAEKYALNDFEKFRVKFKDAMDDDLNTADAIAAIFELVTEINKDVKDGCSKEMAEKSLGILLELTGVLGLLETEKDESVDDEISKLVEERQQARAEKNFQRADEIRDMLKERGITLKDTPQGVQIIKAE